MATYRSLTKIALSGSPEDLGHLIGLSAVIMRLIEFHAGADKDAVKQLAGHLMDHALADIERQHSDETTSEQRGTINDQARAAVRQVLLPLVEAQSIQ